MEPLQKEISNGNAKGDNPSGAGMLMPQHGHEALPAGSTVPVLHRRPPPSLTSPPTAGPAGPNTYLPPHSGTSGRPSAPSNQEFRQHSLPANRPQYGYYVPHSQTPKQSQTPNEFQPASASLQQRMQQQQQVFRDAQNRNHGNSGSHAQGRVPIVPHVLHEQQPTPLRQKMQQQQQGFRGSMQNLMPAHAPPEEYAFYQQYYLGQDHQQHPNSTHLVPPTAFQHYGHHLSQQQQQYQALWTGQKPAHLPPQHNMQQQHKHHSTDPPQTTWHNHNPQLAANAMVVEEEQRKALGPKKPKTGYIIFSNEIREKVIADLHIETGGNYRSQDVIKRTGEIWRGLSSAEKNVFQEKGKEERRKYEDECARLGVTPFEKTKKPVLEEQEEETPDEPRKVKTGNEPEPRKAKTGYVFFSCEVRDKVKADLRAEMGPEFRSQAMFSRISEMWKALGPEQRAAYTALGAADRRRYKGECAALGVTPFEKKPKKKPPPPGPPGPGPKEGEGGPGGGAAQEPKKPRAAAGEGAGGGGPQQQHPQGYHGGYYDGKDPTAEPVRGQKSKQPTMDEILRGVGDEQVPHVAAVAERKSGSASSKPTVAHASAVAGRKSSSASSKLTVSHASAVAERKSSSASSKPAVARASAVAERKSGSASSKPTGPSLSKKVDGLPPKARWDHRVETPRSEATAQAKPAPQQGRKKPLASKKASSKAKAEAKAAPPQVGEPKPAKDEPSQPKAQRSSKTLAAQQAPAPLAGKPGRGKSLVPPPAPPPPEAPVLATEAPPVAPPVPAAGPGGTGRAGQGGGGQGGGGQGGGGARPKRQRREYHRMGDSDEEAPQLAKARPKLPSPLKAPKAGKAAAVAATAAAGAPGSAGRGKGNKRRRSKSNVQGEEEEQDPVTEYDQIALELRRERLTAVVKRLAQLDSYRLYEKGDPLLNDGTYAPPPEAAAAAPEDNAPATAPPDTAAAAAAPEATAPAADDAAAAPEATAPAAAAAAARSLADLEARAGAGAYFTPEGALDLARLRADFDGMCARVAAVVPAPDAARKGTLGYLNRQLRAKGLALLDKELKREAERLAKEEDNKATGLIAGKLEEMIQNSVEPCFQGKWRQRPYPDRQYSKITEYVAAENLNKGDQEGVLQMLDCNLPTDRFLGQPYSFDNHGLIMDTNLQSFVAGTGGRNSRRKAADDEDEEAKRRRDDAVIKPQVQSLLRMLVDLTHERAMNAAEVLRRAPHRLAADPHAPYSSAGGGGGGGEEEEEGEGEGEGGGAAPARLREQAVWGLDCFCRRNVEMALEVDGREQSQAREFIQKWLLPAINRQAPDKAAYIENALNELAGPKNNDDADAAAADATAAAAPPAWVRAAAATVAAAAATLPRHYFLVHPKGTGLVVAGEGPLPADTYINSYLGELYPSWRWCERQDAIAEAEKALGVGGGLPDFYNILLERPRADARGYGLLYVEANRVGNLSSSLSHSCDANCGTYVVSRGGRLAVAVVTTRPVAPGEELTMDYNSTTTEEAEWRAAICLCASPRCRGSFLHFAGADDFQQVLEEVSGPLVTFCFILRSSNKKSLTDKERELLEGVHGLRAAALGPGCPPWLRWFATVALQFIEHERATLPRAMLAKYLEDRAAREKAIQRQQRRKKPEPGEEPLRPLPAPDQGEIDLAACGTMERRVQSLVTALGAVHHVLALLHRRGGGGAGHGGGGGGAGHGGGGGGAGHGGGGGGGGGPGGQGRGRGRRRGDAAAAPQKGKGGKRGNKQQRGAKVKEEEAEEEEETESTAPPSLEDFPPPLRVMDEQEILDHLWNGRGSVCRRLVKRLRGELADPAQKAVAGRMAQLLDREQRQVPDRAAARAAMGRLRDLLLELRPTKALRHHAAADLLLLYANTEIWVTLNTEAYAAVASDPLPVYRKDLSGPIPKNDKQKRKRKSSIVKEEQSDGDSAKAPEEEEDTSADDSTVDNEKPVYEYTRTYEAAYVLAQLVEWQNYGQQTKLPNLLGCARLPDPCSCYVGEKAYSNAVRSELLKFIMSPKLRNRAWPSEVMEAFPQAKWEENHPKDAAAVKFIFGSPALDWQMGVDAGLQAVVDALTAALPEDQRPAFTPSPPRGGAGGGGRRRRGAARLASPKDSASKSLGFLQEKNWVQCENTNCMKWRLLPWHIDTDALPEKFYCKDNKWNAKFASCDAPEDQWDQHYTDVAARYSYNLDQFAVGDYLDTYCAKDRQWYNSKVVEVEPDRVKVHYDGWSTKYDVWISKGPECCAPVFTRTEKTGKLWKRFTQGKLQTQKLPEQGQSTSATKPLPKEDGKKRASNDGGLARHIKEEANTDTDTNIGEDDDEKTKAAKRKQQQKKPGGGGAKKKQQQEQGQTNKRPRRRRI